MMHIESAGTIFRKLMGCFWVTYLAKALLLVGALFLFAKMAPSLPPLVVGLFWALLSAAASLGFAYQVVVRKTYKQYALEEGGRLFRFNNGRAFWLIAGFIVSAICAMGIIFEAPKWDDGEWLMVLLSVPLYAGVFAATKTALKGEMKRPFLTARLIAWSCGAVGVLLCALFAVLVFMQPAATFESADAAFLAAEQPFSQSPSVLLSEAGKLAALIDGLTTYGVAKTAEVSFTGYVIARLIIAASALFGVAGLLGFCSLKGSELKRVFLPLENLGEKGVHRSIVRRYVVLAAALPLCLTVLFAAADFKAAEVSQMGEFTMAEKIVRDQVGIAAYIIDGKYYDQLAVEELVGEMKGRSEELFGKLESEVVPLVNASFDVRLANVDSYLDWYYSLPADYERLGNLITGSVESYASEQFKAKIEEGIDDSQISGKLEELSGQAKALKSEFETRLADCELSDAPTWLLTAQEVSPTDLFSGPLGPTEKLLEAPERFGVSAAAGMAGGILSKKLVEKVLKKEFFGKIVGKMSSALATRAAGGAAGAAAGSVVPGIGTIAGLAAGTAIGVGADYGMLKLDEAQNRETYKQEIIDTIEEQRAEVLASLQDDN